MAGVSCKRRFIHNEGACRSVFKTHGNWKLEVWLLRCDMERLEGGSREGQ